MSTTITHSKLPMAILEGHGSTLTILEKVSTLIGEVDTHHAANKTALATDGKIFIGMLYSSSLFDDATDNIFYQLNINPTTDGKDWFGQLTFHHNATQLNTGFLISPADVQEAGTSKGKYAIQVINNITFPRYLTHLLYQAIDKFIADVTGKTFNTLPNVAILTTSGKSFR